MGHDQPPWVLNNQRGIDPPRHAGARGLCVKQAALRSLERGLEYVRGAQAQGGAYRCARTRVPALPNSVCKPALLQPVFPLHFLPSSLILSYGLGFAQRNRVALQSCVFDKSHVALVTRTICSAHRKMPWLHGRESCVLCPLPGWHFATVAFSVSF